MEKKAVTIVVFSGELDRAPAAFNIANAAASMGLPVTMFFAFWGLDVIKKEEGRVGSGYWMKRMMNLINRGGAKRLKLSPMNMGGMGASMINKLMSEHNLPTLGEMIKTASELGVRMVACTTSMALMGLGEDDFIPEVREFAGAATCVNQALDSGLNLFI